MASMGIRPFEPIRIDSSRPAADQLEDLRTADCERFRSLFGRQKYMNLRWTSRLISNLNRCADIPSAVRKITSLPTNKWTSGNPKPDNMQVRPTLNIAYASQSRAVHDDDHIEMVCTNCGQRMTVTTNGEQGTTGTAREQQSTAVRRRSWNRNGESIACPPGTTTQP